MASPRRNSNDSGLPSTRKSDPTPPPKVRLQSDWLFYLITPQASLLPNVITPQFGLVSALPDRGTGTTFSQYLQRGRGRLQPLTKTTSSSVQPPSPLSVVAESAERTLSYPSLHDDGGSGNSTLKASSASDFETDSLEAKKSPTNEIPVSVVSPLGLNTSIVSPSMAAITPSPLEGQMLNLFPPTPGN